MRFEGRTAPNRGEPKDLCAAAMGSTKVNRGGCDCRLYSTPLRRLSYTSTPTARWTLPPQGDTLDLRPQTPLSSEIGSEDLMGKRDFECAKKLIQEAGYKGEKVVIISASDQWVVHS